MIKRLIFCFAISLSFVSCHNRMRQERERTPKLVIGIVVDQMRYDYLYRYRTKWCNGGFKRLMREGFFFEDAQYNYVPTFTGPGHTAIYTGCTPSMNGIIANDWFDKKSGAMVYCAQDDNEHTVGAPTKAGQMSPRRELTSTIGDMLKLSDNGKSKVVGISLKDRASILPAGHWANEAYWVDDSTGNWITSTYYKLWLPKWVEAFNKEGHALAYLSKPWYASLPLKEYDESQKDDSYYEKPYKTESAPIFPHNLPVLMEKNGWAGLIKATPFGDDLTKDFAIETIKKDTLGKRGVTDMLCISFSSTDYVGHQFGTESVELEDTYIRLDKNLEELLSFIDRYIGRENVLLFLTADHGAAVNAQYLMDRNIPAGYLDDIALLTKVNSGLNKKYGAELALQFCNQQFYLDDKTMEEKKLDKNAIEDEVAAIALQTDGVERAIPSYKLNEVNKDFINSKILNGFYPARSGDVIVNLLPNWLIYSKKGTTHGAPYEYDAHVPLLFWGGIIPRGSTTKEEAITNIAPTVCNLLHIASPDGCVGKPMDYRVSGAE